MQKIIKYKIIGKIYLIYDNYERPFKVIINKNTVYIYKIPKNIRKILWDDRKKQLLMIIPNLLIS